jgi:hypothetical protein
MLHKKPLSEPYSETVLEENERAERINRILEDAENSSVALKAMDMVAKLQDIIRVQSKAIDGLIKERDAYHDELAGLRGKEAVNDD